MKISLNLGKPHKIYVVYFENLYVYNVVRQRGGASEYFPISVGKKIQGAMTHDSIAIIGPEAMTALFGLVSRENVSVTFIGTYDS